MPRTQSRIQKIEPHVIDGEFEEFYGAVTGLLGRVPHFYRTISNAPFLAMLFLPINAAAQREWPGTRVSGKIKEMVVIKTSHTNGCDYCYAHNTSLGQAAGITHDQIIAMSSDDYLTSDLFSEREKAAILWADNMTRNTAQKNGDAFNRLHANFTEGEIVEITMLCAMFNMINRVNDSLDIALEEQPEIDKIQSSLHLDPAKMGDYLRWLADHWPSEFETMNKQAEDAAAA
ncbi:MAG: carboxymuconolactone decarboxylase family protein [Alphaproteobacteria bacterium]|jgi:AhpD family alkylhydroperoxidase|nr:carboxymuconolactone decarboxylase family protein [Alphaproteobacteria bacterium]